MSDQIPGPVDLVAAIRNKWGLEKAKQLWKRHVANGPGANRIFSGGADPSPCTPGTECACKRIALDPSLEITAAVKAAGARK